MTKATALSPAQLAARLCLRLNTEPLDKVLITEEELQAICRIGGSPVAADELIQISAKLRQHPDFEATTKANLEKWRQRMIAEGLFHEEDALAFIAEMFGSMDHAHMYDHGITASSTLVERERASVGELQFPGKMPCWTLHLTLSGEALLLTNSTDIQLCRGDMMLFHPNASYHYGLHPSADHWEHLWALFVPRPHWSEWLHWNALDDGILHLSLPDEASVALMESLFRSLIELKNESGELRNDLQHNRLEEILIRANEYTSRPASTKVDRRVQNACDYMREHLTEKFSVEDIAAACSVSCSRLAHLFKQQMGVSPKAWSNDMRLQQARKLLISSNRSISAIALQVGYEDPTQFTRNFKKNLGCSPRAFRQSFRDQQIA